MKTFVSDTLAGSANQSFFYSDGTDITCRVYFKVFCGGSEYKIYFSDTVDSTFADGTYSVANDTCGNWDILSLRAGVCEACGMDEPSEPSVFSDALFDGKKEKSVSAGESFSTDIMHIFAKKGDYLCVEYVVRGKKLPCHPEIQIPTFVYKNGAWQRSVYIPVPYTVEVNREVKKRVCFLGDSITQGIGATPNGYCHWCAVASEYLGDDYAGHNLGIGYARASDAATDGGWLSKAKQSDICVLCLGTNDIIQGADADSVCQSIVKVKNILEEQGVQVILQTVPPFEYPSDGAERWAQINRCLKFAFENVFDNTAFLCEKGSTLPLYGGHPNDMGCKIWGERIADYIKATVDNG